MEMKSHLFKIMQFYAKQEATYVFLFFFFWGGDNSAKGILFFLFDVMFSF